jgi:trans-aconitate methyltransferase
MTLTHLAFVGGTPAADLVTDDDLKVLHPRIVADLWPEKTTYRPQLLKAFDRLLTDLASHGYVTAQIPDSVVNRAWAKAAVIAQAFVLIFRDFTTTDGDRWSLLKADYLKEYVTLLANVSVEYDADNDGTADTDPVSAPLVLTR